MDTTSRFRIDMYEATQARDVQKSVPIKEPSAFQSYQLAEGDQQALNIDFRCLNGMRYALAYTYLTYIEYNPDPTNERVILYYSGYEVTIRGINLLFLYELAMNRNLVWVKEVNMQLLERYQELQPANDNLPGDIPLVIEIRVIKIDR